MNERKRTSNFCLATAAIIFASGCLGSPSDPGAAPSLPLALPRGLTMEHATIVKETDGEVVWKWEGMAAPSGVGVSGSLVGYAPFVESRVMVPPGLPLLFAAKVSSDADVVTLGLEIRDVDGAPLCRSANGATSSQACGIPIAALESPSSVVVRVESLYVEPPGAPFVVEAILALDVSAENRRGADSSPGRPEPHVLVAITDSGVNPYHEVYFRPHRTAHPCTYIQGFPCDVPALDLSIGVYEEYAMAVAADREVWDSVTPGSWYWIPKTALVALHCVEGIAATCILDDTGHGTYTSSAVLQENPEALLLLNQGNAGSLPYVFESPFPVDIHSFSFAPPQPLIADEERVYAGNCQAFTRGKYADPHRLLIAAAGNFPLTGSPTSLLGGSTWTGGTPSTIVDCASGNPNIISVGGAFASDREESALGARNADVVSWFCRPLASASSTTEFVVLCGTSFAAPTVAGALSKAILEVRRVSGYTGSVSDGYVDPLLGVTNNAIRGAMNLTASYAPKPNHNTTGTGVPLVEAAPWFQWGWGFYDETVTNATIAHILGTDTATHPAQAVTWMQTQHDVKKRLWGS